MQESGTVRAVFRDGQRAEKLSYMDLGKARHGVAGLGLARQGTAWRGMDQGAARHGMAGHGMAGYGLAGRGMAWYGEAWIKVNPQQGGMKMQERIPTKSEVDFLIERIGIPAEGRLVKRLEIQAAIGREVSESRYRSIVNSWKKRLFGQYDVLMLTDHQGDIAPGISGNADGAGDRDCGQRRQQAADRRIGGGTAGYAVADIRCEVGVVSADCRLMLFAVGVGNCSNRMAKKVRYRMNAVTDKMPNFLGFIPCFVELFAADCFRKIMNHFHQRVPIFRRQVIKFMVVSGEILVADIAGASPFTVLGGENDLGNTGAEFALQKLKAP